MMNRLWMCLLILGCCLAWTQAPEGETGPFDEATVAQSEKLIGLTMSEAERRLMLKRLWARLADYEAIRARSLENATAPALHFNPLPAGPSWEPPDRAPVFAVYENVKRPDNLETCAYWPVGKLAVLLRTGQVSSSELTRMYLARLKKYGSRLECVVALTENLALEQARQADEEIRAGNYRGPLHGIPYGAKDLFAVKGYRTTWGAMPYKDQVIEQNAAVIQKLEKAGAVLVAKLTLGALAWGDVWYGGKTRNPWNLEQGSSGSSAGSAAATAAGLVAFSLGTETYGSIVSPSTHCGVTGLRPTFGRVARTGAMALSWSMDKIGPICRSADDCALVFEAIRGADGVDASVLEAPFPYQPLTSLQGLRIGYISAWFEEDHRGKEQDLQTLEILRGLGPELVPIQLPDFPVQALSLILTAEAAAAFDELTRSGRDDLLVRQIEMAWPNFFRASRFIPAVEYIQANRIRTQLIEAMAVLMKEIDLYVCPSYGGDNLLLTNLTGHPSVVVPNGFSDPQSPTSITFIGRLFDEARILGVARAYQQATDHHRHIPEKFK